MKRLYVAALAAALAASGAAIAQTADPSPQDTPGQRGPGPALQRIDTDHDGIISRAEFLASAAMRFDRMDINKDGTLSADEMATRGGPGRGGQARRGPPPPGALPPPDDDDAGPARPPRAAAMFARLDTDSNGTISRAEFDTPMDRSFDRIDANHDGRIDQAEMTAAADRRRDRAGAFGGRRPGARRGQQFSDAPPPPPAPGEDQ